MDLSSEKTGIIGSGGWGTALALILSLNNKNIILWSYENDVANEINFKHTNSAYLPGILLNDSIKCTTDIVQLAESKYIILAVPSVFIREITSKFKSILKDKIIINVAKGIERGTLYRVSEILTDTLQISKDKYVVITGPSHAEEVARGSPTAVVCASENHNLSVNVQKLLSTNFFRIYSSEDVVGCEIGGAVKNVIAIAAGIVDGLGLGDNTKAALLTRGLAEISRLGITLGAESRTFSGLSGLGDLIVTCNSKHSRNRRVGELIAKGKTIKHIENETRMVAEGIYTTESAMELGNKVNIEMPITEQVYNILFHDKNPLDAIRELMLRTYKKEWW